MNSLAFQVVVSILPLLGIAGIIGGYITHLLGRKKELDFQVLEHKQKRYKSCLLFMDAYLEPANTKYLANVYKGIHDQRDLAEWLKMEYYEMLFYAPASVALSVKEFINTPSRDQFLKTILVMRSDLWIRKKDLDLPQIKLNNT